MKLVGKINDVQNVTAEEKKSFFLQQDPIYDWDSCSCQFGFKCDVDIHPNNRIIGYKAAGIPDGSIQRQDRGH